MYKGLLALQIFRHGIVSSELTYQESKLLRSTWIGIDIEYRCYNMIEELQHDRRVTTCNSGDYKRYNVIEETRFFQKSFERT